MNTQLEEIQSVLRVKGVKCGELEWIKEDRVAADHEHVVVRLCGDTFGGRNTLARYLDDLNLGFIRAGVPSERPLLDEVVPLSNGSSLIALSYLKALPEPPADTPRQVGALIRRIHDDVWPFAETRESDDEVYCMDDWYPRNIIITDEGPVVIDL